MLNALFFGTSAFALPSLDVVADRTHLLGVVTQPDRPAGRGQHLTPSPVKAAASGRAVRVYEPSNLRDFAATIAPLGLDLIVVASYGRILKSDLLALPALGALNVHPSLLPRYRGATPIAAALLAGDDETGVTIMLMDEGMDTGDVVLQERVRIEPAEEYGALHDRLARSGAALLTRALDLGEREGAFPHRRQEGEPSVTRPATKDDLRIDWIWSARRIVNHVRAYAPQPAARATIAGAAVKILRCHEEPLPRAAAPGEIVGTGGGAVLVACGDGAIAVEWLIAANHRRESGMDFARRLRA